ncbi:MAG TPA: dUTP diphosphatase [Candidatus Hydrogenedentes bacterium]|nr:dUTP diphosphatase [Candidatus Hydrogenedentota bacterium]
MKREVVVAVKQLAGTEDLPLPVYETEHASGMDLRAAITQDILLSPGERMAVPTGLCIAIPPGYEAQVRPRSGWALREGVTMINAPGTIDADYRGEIKVLLVNLGAESVTITRGDRIAQLIVGPVAHVAWERVAELDETGRGAGGFGHTGR